MEPTAKMVGTKVLNFREGDNTEDLKSHHKIVHDYLNKVFELCINVVKESRNLFIYIFKEKGMILLSEIRYFSNLVEGLVSLQNAFEDLQDWSGDPCLPAPYTWDWINCSNDATPRVTAL